MWALETLRPRAIGQLVMSTELSLQKRVAKPPRPPQCLPRRALGASDQDLVPSGPGGSLHAQWEAVPAGRSPCSHQPASAAPGRPPLPPVPGHEALPFPLSPMLTVLPERLVSDGVIGTQALWVHPRLLGFGNSQWLYPVAEVWNALFKTVIWPPETAIPN